MTQKAETTRVTLKYPAAHAPALTGLGPALARVLGTEVQQPVDMHTVVNGLYFDMGGMALTVTICPDRPDEIRVVAMGPDDGSAGSPRARQRLHACAVMARFLSTEARPLRTEWRHRGGFYITEGGQIAVVSGMRGTSGEGARRKAAARAFSLYGHDRSRPNVSRRRRVTFRIGGHTRQTTPVKLAQTALNTTLCVLSLPVGAAVMTHQLLSGGSLATSARWMAVTGTGLTLSAPEVLNAVSALL